MNDRIVLDEAEGDGWVEVGTYPRGAVEPHLERLFAIGRAMLPKPAPTGIDDEGE